MTSTTTIADVASKISGVTNRAAWTSTPTSSGKVTVPAGYHNGSGYVDTSKVYNAGVSAGGYTIKQVYSGSNYKGTVNIKSSYPDIYSSVTVDNFLFKPIKMYLSMYICYPDVLQSTHTYTFSANSSYSYNSSTGVLTYNLGSPGGTETNAYIVSAYCNSLKIYLIY